MILPLLDFLWAWCVCNVVTKFHTLPHISFTSIRPLHWHSGGVEGQGSGKNNTVSSAKKKFAQCLPQCNAPLSDDALRLADQMPF